mgnify:CR=1 FL=1
MQKTRSEEWVVTPNLLHLCFFLQCNDIGSRLNSFFYFWDDFYPSQSSPYSQTDVSQLVRVKILYSKKVKMVKILLENDGI